MANVQGPKRHQYRRDYCCKSMKQDGGYELKSVWPWCKNETREPEIIRVNSMPNQFGLLACFVHIFGAQQIAIFPMAGFSFTYTCSLPMDQATTHFCKQRLPFRNWLLKSRKQVALAASVQVMPKANLKCFSKTHASCSRILPSTLPIGVGSLDWGANLDTSLPPFQRSPSATV